MLSDQEPFLSRWSRRKQQSSEEVQIAETPEEELQVSTSDVLTGEIENAEQEDLPVLTDEDMPPIESLNEESDFSGFMSKGVSDELRNLALKKLFQASVFNVRDGLDEYDEDFTKFEKLGDIITCDMKHQIEMEAKKKLEREEEQESQRLLEEAEQNELLEVTDSDNPSEINLAETEVCELSEDYFQKDSQTQSQATKTETNDSDQNLEKL